ncbi:ribosome small subunit-dependent GTPase A [Pseudonocardia eucalypti]|uniref:Ribosome small subunit-dependent GTPase A n=1 Tax=Pseudonocardia eucalypti TaxID=648755 RepID=A0ABP9PT58_9PSEU|nr:ribosome biogenesis GTPase [Pseudonocardia eucalypti]
MSPREYDESDVRVRPGRGTRPRTKRRPDHADAAPAMVVAVDRGRWTCVPDGAAPSQHVVAMRARELGRTPIVVGDQVDLVGDVSGEPGALARIVRVAERSSVLRRTADDDDPYERLVVANAEQLIIVVALASPQPSVGFVDRALVAAYAGGLTPVLCLTKADLAPAESVAEPWAELDLPVLVTRHDQPPSALRSVLDGRVSAMLGHSGVGKSTLVNALVPDAFRAVGVVSGVGKGRHTSSSAVALPLDPSSAEAGWIVDTPGVRSFGLAHVSATDVVTAFADLASAVDDCPRGCGHLGPPTDPECELDQLVARGGVSPGRLTALRRVLVALSAPSWSV